MGTGPGDIFAKYAHIECQAVVERTEIVGWHGIEPALPQGHVSGALACQVAEAQRIELDEPVGIGLVVDTFVFAEARGSSVEE